MWNNDSKLESTFQLIFGGVMAERRTPRRQRIIDGYRNEIIEAAVNLFYRKGVQGAAVQEIADEAELGVGTIYRIFPNGKDEIYLAIQETVVEDFEHFIKEEMNGAGDEIDTIRRHIRASARVYSEHHREMAVYLRGTAGLGLHLGRGLSEELAVRYLACAEYAGDALVRGMDKGIFRTLNKEDAQLFLRATINAFLMRWIDDGRTYPIEECIACIEEVFLHGVII